MNGKAPPTGSLPQVQGSGLRVPEAFSMALPCQALEEEENHSSRRNPQTLCRASPTGCPEQTLAVIGLELLERHHARLTSKSCLVIMHGFCKHEQPEVGERPPLLQLCKVMGTSYTFRGPEGF